MSEWTCSVCDESFDPTRLPKDAVIVSEMCRRKIVRVGTQTHILRLKHGGRKPTSPVMPDVGEPLAQGETDVV